VRATASKAPPFYYYFLRHFNCRGTRRIGSVHTGTSVDRILIVYTLATVSKERIRHRIGSAHQVTSIGLHESGTISKHKSLYWKNRSDEVEDLLCSAHQVTSVGLHKTGTIPKHKLLYWKNERDDRSISNVEEEALGG